MDGGGGGGGGDEPRSTDAPTDGTRTRCSLRTQGNLEQEALEDRKGDGFRSPDPAFVPASAKRARSPSSGRADPHCKRKFPLKKKKKKQVKGPLVLCSAVGAEGTHLHVFSGAGPRGAFPYRVLCHKASSIRITTPLLGCEKTRRENLWPLFLMEWKRRST